MSSVPSEETSLLHRQVEVGVVLPRKEVMTPFEPAHVGPRQIASMTLHASLRFDPIELYFNEEADYFDVLSTWIDGNPQQSNYMSAREYLFFVRILFTVVGIGAGGKMVLAVRNNSDKPRTLRGAILGHVTVE